MITWIPNTFVLLPSLLGNLLSNDALGQNFDQLLCSIFPSQAHQVTMYSSAQRRQLHSTMSIVVIKYSNFFFTESQHICTGWMALAYTYMSPVVH